MVLAKKNFSYFSKKLQKKLTILQRRHQIFTFCSKGAKNFSIFLGGNFFFNIQWGSRKEFLGSRKKFLGSLKKFLVVGKNAQNFFRLRLGDFKIRLTPDRISTFFQTLNVHYNPFYLYLLEHHNVPNNYIVFLQGKMLYSNYTLGRAAFRLQLFLFKIQTFYNI